MVWASQEKEWCPDVVGFMYGMCRDLDQTKKGDSGVQPDVNKACSQMWTKPYEGIFFITV